MANPFVHVELNTSHSGQAKTFYSQLFDWKLEDVPLGPGTYTMIHPGQAPDGGIMQHPGPHGPSLWLVYVLVDDIQAATAKAKSLGAKLERDVTEVPGIGWVSIIIDPTGAMLGLFKPAPRAAG
ncbi:MAG TPA: VOC family protein [Bryobacteraceae bacterium]|nr:VOC family protein [Bryobacteraceae bacterium]